MSSPLNTNPVLILTVQDFGDDGGQREDNEKTQHMMAMVALYATGWRSGEGGKARPLGTA